MNNWLQLNQLWRLTVALSREITREPGVLFWGILFPILMSLGLGLAFTQKADTIRKVAVISNPDVTGVLPGNTLLSEFLQEERSVKKTVSLKKKHGNGNMSLMMKKQENQYSSFTSLTGIFQ